METKFSLLLLLSIQSFFPHLLLFSIRPSLQGVLSPLLYTFQFPSFKVRVAIKLALNLSLSLLPDAADSLWVSATQGKLLSWVLFYLKVAALKNLLVSLFSRMCLSLSSFRSSLLQFRFDTCFRVLYGFSRNFLFPSFQSLRNFPLYKLIISTLSPSFELLGYFLNVLFFSFLFFLNFSFL